MNLKTELQNTLVDRKHFQILLVCFHRLAQKVITLAYQFSLSMRERFLVVQEACNDFWEII